MKKWTEKETQFLIENYNVINITKLSKILNRSITAITGKIHYLKNKNYSINLTVKLPTR